MVNLRRRASPENSFSNAENGHSDRKRTKLEKSKSPKAKSEVLQQIDGPKADRWDIMIRVNAQIHMVPETILITGASRGIGLGFLRNFLKYSQVKTIIGTVRNEADREKLKKLDSRVQPVLMDLGDPKSILRAGKQISNIVGKDGINLLINNAGILEPYDLTGKPDREKLRKQMMINTIGPLLLVQTLVPLLKNAARCDKSDESIPICVGRSAVINISPIQSSTTINNFGSNILGIKDCTGHAMSKSALNQLTRGLSADLLPDGILVASMMPGTVKTDLGGEEAQLTVDDSCSLMVNTMLKLQQHHSGQFISLQGNLLDF